MDIYKRHFTFNGLNHARQLEADRIHNNEDEMQRKLQLQQKEEELKRTLYGRLDPTHMKINLPDPPEVSGGISFDPDDMVFNFDK